MDNSLVNRVLARIYGVGRGGVFTPKDFLDLASHDTVRQILSRLVHAGTIRRLLRGVYEYPAFSAVLNAPASPDPDAIARAIARAHGWTIFPSGETALNMLGLSTQVPARWEYFSDGPTKKYEWAGGTLILKHRANKETTALSPKTALVVQALKTLKQDHVDDRVLAALRTRLNARDRTRAVREARYATSWVYEIIKRLAAEEVEPHA
jgi:predicted transcriptional regulator of viral defense system